MGKIRRKSKIKAKKKRLKPLEETIDQAIVSAANKASDVDGDTTEFQKFIQTHMLAVCVEVLMENKKEILKRTEERINAVQTMQEHQQCGAAGFYTGAGQ